MLYRTYDIKRTSIWDSIVSLSTRLSKKLFYYSGKDGPMGVGHPLHAKKKWDNLKNQIQNMYMCYQ